MATLRPTCIALLVLATSAAPARAEGGAPGGDERDEEVRLAWLERVLDRESYATRAWRGAWIGVYAGASALEAVLTGLHSKPDQRAQRVDDAVNLGKAVIAFTFVLVIPADAGPRADTARAMPKNTRAERIAKLRFAEASLRAIAAEERERRGWFGLIGNAALNAVGAGISWGAIKGTTWANGSGNGNGARGWIGLATGFVIGQLQFHTQPTGAIRAWDAYQRAGAGARLDEPPPVLRWSIQPSAGGAAVRVTF